MGAGQSVAGEEDGDGSGEIQRILDEWESGDSNHAAGVESEEKTPTSLGRQHQAHDDDYSPAPPRYDQPQAAATGAPPESTLSETLMQLIPFYGGGDDSDSEEDEDAAEDEDEQDFTDEELDDEDQAYLARFG